MTDNVTSAPSVGQSAINQKDEGRAEQVGSQDREDLSSGKICLLNRAVGWSDWTPYECVTEDSTTQTAEQQKPHYSFYT